MEEESQAAARDLNISKPSVSRSSELDSATGM